MIKVYIKAFLKILEILQVLIISLKLFTKM